MNIEIWSAIRYELLASVLVFVCLFLKLLDADRRPRALLIGINIVLVLFFAFFLLPMKDASPFQSFFVTNSLIVFEKGIIVLGMVLVSILSYHWLSQRPNLILEFYLLMLSSLIGSFMIVSSGHLLTLYLGVETSTLPLAAMINFQREDKRASESAIKLILSSSFATAVMLYGISMLYGAYGDLHYSALQTALRPDLLTIVGFSFMMGGLFFKMAAVPFHFWAADVYEGAPVPVVNFLSVASKGSVVFVFISLLVTVFDQIKVEWVSIISWVAVLSMTIGNLFAMRQTNIKRFLAFSSVSQVGFILVGATGATLMGVNSTVYFMVIYILCSVGAFGVVGAVSDATGREDIESYRGFFKTNPFLAVVFTIVLLSFAGIPPTAGFFGKLFLLTSSLGEGQIVLVGIAGFNLLLSLYNYFRIVGVIYFKEPMYTEPIHRHIIVDVVLTFCAIAVLLIGFAPGFFDWVVNASSAAFAR